MGATVAGNELSCRPARGSAETEHWLLKQLAGVVLTRQCASHELDTERLLFSSHCFLPSPRHFILVCCHCGGDLKSAIEQVVQLELVGKDVDNQTSEMEMLFLQEAYAKDPIFWALDVGLGVGIQEGFGNLRT